MRRQRETYVGEWLPEPLLTSPDVAEDVELAETIPIAMLTVLETLGPIERAVFVLREVFDVPYGEIAGAVGKTPAAVRQIAHRAREHVAARRPRTAVSHTEQQAAVESFRAAIQNGDLHGLLDVLAPGCGVRGRRRWAGPAMRRPVVGAERVARLLAGLAANVPDALARSVWLNGTPALRIDLGGALDTAVSLVVEDGRISRIYAIRNPHKLSGLAETRQLSRTP